MTNRVSSYARGYTERALATLAKIMDDEGAPPTARVAASNAILDRGWGRPSQPISGDEDNPLRVVQRIECVIVDPTEPPPY